MPEIPTSELYDVDRSELVPELAVHVSRVVGGEPMVTVVLPEGPLTGREALQLLDLLERSLQDFRNRLAMVKAVQKGGSIVAQTYDL